MNSFKKFIRRKKTQRVLFAFYILLFVGAFFPHLYRHAFIKAAPQKPITCPQPGQEIILNFFSTGFESKTIPAKFCDKLIIINKDIKPHKIAFGSHEHHYPYPGFEEKVLLPEETNTIILSQAGEYQIHDHLQEELKSELMITR